MFRQNKGGMKMKIDLAPCFWNESSLLRQQLAQAYENGEEGSVKRISWTLDRLQINFWNDSVYAEAS